MGDIVGRKITALLTAVIGVFTLMAALLCINTVIGCSKNVNENKLNVDVGLLAAELEKSDNYAQIGYYPFDYAVILTDGTVAFQKGTDYDGTVNLHALAGAGGKLYTMPLLRGGEQFATLAVRLDSADYFDGSAAVLPITLIILVLICAYAVYFAILKSIKNDIFVPIKQLHSATRDILDGKSGGAVKYDYDGEIGTLCHDFELMRTELNDSFAREAEMKADEKLLMASISHDLKTPLATVQGYLESICIGIVAEDEIKPYCQRALDKTVLLCKMTGDILELSKAELRQLSVQKKEVYSAEFFGRLAEGIAADAKSRGFTLEYGEIPNVIISLDETRIAQVMENLVGNSIKYGNEGGRINISFSLEGNFFHVLVCDDGPGIASEDLPFIFDRFYRGDKSRTMSISGSGLGLSIAKYIVEQHGGKIECDSVLGHGAAFEFRIYCG